MIVNKIPKIGQKYLMREFPTLGSNDLHKVKVVRLTHLGDDTVIVSYRYNWPFPLIDDMELKEFLRNTENIHDH